MSRAEGLAILPNGDKYYFQYCGTSDVCRTNLFNTSDELWENWDKDNNGKCICNDKKNEKEVILSSSYGYWNFLFKSKICIKCLCITGKTDNFY